MRRFMALLILCMSVLSIAFTGCGVNRESSKNTPVVTTIVTPTVTPAVTPSEQNDLKPTNDPNKKIINIWCYGDDVPKAIEKFKELHPDFGYEIKTNDLINVCESYQVMLDDGLAAGGSDAPDIYSVESAYANKYTQGEKYQYAADYKDLGIDVDTLLKEASIPKYSIDVGTNPEGKLVGLGYQSTGSAFIYRRSIAKDVWGTDDPSIIKDIIGPGWDKYFLAAADLKAKGYGICSSADDLWLAVANNSAQGWVVDGKLVIDPKREEFLDLAMKLKKNDYSNNSRAWLDDWYEDIKGEGKKQVFGFLGPAWFLNYIITSNSGGETVGEGTYGDWAICEPPVASFWGGTWVLANKGTKAKDGVGEIIKWITLDTSDTGFQYLLANDKLGLGTKETVASVTVMKKSDGKSDFLGGQNLFEVYIPAAEKANGKNATEYDDAINLYWLNQVQEYTEGKKSREQAITDFKQLVADNLDVIIE